MWKGKTGIVREGSWVDWEGDGRNKWFDVVLLAKEKGRIRRASS